VSAICLCVVGQGCVWFCVEGFVQRDLYPVQALIEWNLVHMTLGIHRLLWCVLS